MKKVKGTEWLFRISKSGNKIKLRVADSIVLPNRSASKKQVKFHNVDRKVIGGISDVMKPIEPVLPMSNNLSTTAKNCAVGIKPEVDNLADFEESIKNSFNERLLDTPIEELNLSMRAFNALTKAGLKTVNDIINFGLYALQKRKNVGRKTINDIKDAILAIPAKVEQENKIVSFSDAIESILSFITPKRLSIIKARYGYESGKLETLEKIGLRTGVTRERVRQIIAKEIKRIHLRKSRGMQPLIENIEKLLQQHNGIISIKDMANDAYFASGNKNQLIFLVNFLTDCYEERYKILDKKFLSYLSNNEIRTLHSKIREAALRCQFPIDRKVFIKNIILPVGPISEYYLSHHLLYREHIDLLKGTVVSPGRLSVPDRIKLIIRNINRPIHFSEIAQLYRKHFGEAKIKTKDLNRAIHARISDVKDFIIVAPGTFILRDKLRIPDNIGEIVETSKKILHSLKSISDTKYLISELKKRKIDIGELNEYSLKSILLEYPGFLSYRRFEIGIEEFGDKYERKSLNDLVFEILSSAAKSMHIKTIWKEISKQRGYPEYAIDQRLANDSRFIRVAPATYTITKNITQYEEKRKTIIDFAKEWLRLKGTPISAFFVSEVLKATEEIKDLPLGLVEHILATSPEFIRLPNGFYELATK